MEEAWTANRAVDGSRPSCFELTKCLQQAFNPEITGSFGSRPRLGSPVYHNNISSTFKIHLCPSHIEQVLRLPGAVKPDVLFSASLWITLTADYFVGRAFFHALVSISPEYLRLNEPKIVL